MLLLDYSVRPPSYVKDSVVACDSYIWDSVEYTCDTTITKLYTDSFGCDSTFVLTITINHSVLDTITVTAYTPILSLALILNHYLLLKVVIA